MKWIWTEAPRMWEEVNGIMNMASQIIQIQAISLMTMKIHIKVTVKPWLRTYTQGHAPSWMLFSWHLHVRFNISVFFFSLWMYVSVPYIAIACFCYIMIFLLHLPVLLWCLYVLLIWRARMCNERNIQLGPSFVC